MGKISLLFLLLVFISCNHKKEVSDKKIVAYINEEPITITELDNTIKQELYDELNRIHLIRKTALHYFIEDKLIYDEAKKHNITSKEFFDKYYEHNNTDILLQEFIKLAQFEKNGIIDVKRTLRNIDLNSDEGKILVKKEYKLYLRDRLIDSLKKTSKINILLSPPTAPKLAINNLNIHYRGNLSSKVTLITVSDFECDRCIDNYLVLKELFEKYKNKVKFGFVNYSGHVTISALASECAAKQNKFWQFYNKLFTQKQLPDTIKIENIAQELGLDTIQFKSDIRNKDCIQKVKEDFKKVGEIGIYATPTILINGKVIFDSNSKVELEAALRKYL